MDPIIVLTDYQAKASASPALNAAVRLAPVLDAEIVLLPLAAPELVMATATLAEEQRLAMIQLAHSLPTKARVAIAEGQSPAEAAALVKLYHPQLVVIARPTDTEASVALRETVLEMLQLAPAPLLVVPAEKTPNQIWPPSRLVLAADGDPFTLGEGAGVVRQLLRATKGSLTTLRVTAPNIPASHYDAVQHPLEAGLVPFPIIPEALHWIHPQPAEGILDGTRTARAHLLVMVARRRSIWGNLFHKSVTADLMMRSPVPVLLLPSSN